MNTRTLCQKWKVLTYVQYTQKVIPTVADGRISTSFSQYLEDIPDTYDVKKPHPADDTFTDFDVLLTVRLCIILEIIQLNAQNLLL
jgi:hypothetical protein